MSPPRKRSYQPMNDPELVDEARRWLRFAPRQVMGIANPHGIYVIRDS